MNASELSYLSPYVLSFALSVALFAYVWAHRQIPGGTAYACYIGAQALSIFAFLLELVSTGLNAKIAWDKVQWFTEAIIIIAFPIFALQFAEFKLRHPKIIFGLIVALPIFFSLLVIGDPILRLVYLDARLTTDEPFPELYYGFTPAVYLYAAYIYAIILTSIAILIRRIFHVQRLFAIQTIIIVVGLLIPVLASILALLNLRFTPQRDATPITFAIGNLIVVWGLFRFQILDVAPVGRDTVIENLSDPVVVLDLQDRVVDINPATETLIAKSSSQVIGQPARQVFAAWHELFDHFENMNETRIEVSLHANGARRRYELHMSPIHNSRGLVIGRVFTANDITERIKLQTKLEKMNQELETRVRERTLDLQVAYDTTLQGWARTLELRDEETEGHTRRVTELTLQLARAVGLSDKELVHIRRGAILHDIGKMALPDEILRKPARLTPEEFEIVKQHPVIAYELLSPIPFLKQAIAIPYCHHEKWDGSGYPRGLRGTEIPLSARIFMLADVWDAIQSDRPYNKAWPRAQALEYMRAQSGIHFDPHLLGLFLELVA